MTRRKTGTAKTGNAAHERPPPLAPDFFIAHASADKPTASRLYALLHDRPIAGTMRRSTAFLDSESIDLGEDWDKTIPTAQRTARITVILVSSATDDAYYQRDEIAVAIAQARQHPHLHTVVPIVLEDVDPPYGLSIKQSIGYGTPLESAADDLLMLLSQLDSQASSLTARRQPRRFTVEPAPMGVVPRAALLESVVTALVNQRGPTFISSVKGAGGVGKTILATLACYDDRVWSAFSGAILWMAVGEDAEASSLLEGLHEQVTLRTVPKGINGAVALRNAFQELAEPSLVVLDDVWDASPVERLRAILPDNVALLVTTRGVVLEGVDTIEVDRLNRDESREVLLATIDRTDELYAKADVLAELLAGWAVLISMAGRLIRSVASDPETLGVEIDALVSEFRVDPTVLDDNASRERSFDAIVRRSIQALEPQTRERFDMLAVFPPDTRITPDLLADLWSESSNVSIIRDAQRIAHVGLATFTKASRDAPITLSLHDLVVAWLHRRVGRPGSAQLRDCHIRCVKSVMTERGSPLEVSEARAGLVVYHLMNISDWQLVDAFISREWRYAFYSATGSDGLYLSGLRRIAQTIDSLIPEGALLAECAPHIARIAHICLSAGFIADYVANLSDDLLATQGVLGNPRAALYQAATKPDPRSAAGAVIAVIHALSERGVLPPSITAIAIAAASTILEERGRSEALGGVAVVAALAGQSDLALEAAFGVVPTEARDTVLEAVQNAAKGNPQLAFGAASAITDEIRRDKALGVVAAAIAAVQPRLAIIAASAISDSDGSDDALIAVAEKIAVSNPELAVEAALRLVGEERPDESLARVANLIMIIDEREGAKVIERIRSPALRRAARERLASQGKAAVAPTVRIGQDTSVPGHAQTDSGQIGEATLSSDPRVSDETSELGHPPGAETMSPGSPTVQAASPEHQIHALIQAARSVARRDDDSAEQFYMAAAAAASELDSAQSRTDALTIVASNALTTHPRLVMRILSKCSSGLLRDFAFSRVAMRAITLGAPIATELADLVSDGWMQWQVFSAIGESTMKTDPESAADYFARASAVASSLEPAATRNKALAQLAITGGTQAAGYKRMATEAILTAAAIPDPFIRAAVVMRIAIASRLTTEDYANQISSAIADPRLESEIFATISQASVTHDPALAIRAAGKIADARLRSAALARLASVAAAQNPGEADELFCAAIASVDDIEDEWRRNEALSLVVRLAAGHRPDLAINAALHISDVGDRNEGLALVAELAAPRYPDSATRAASAIADDGDRDQALARLAEGIAATHADQAVEILALIRDENAHTRTLARLAGAMAATHPSQARLLYSEAMDAASVVPNDPDRDEALRRIAKALAKRGHKAALEICAVITEGKTHDYALADVAAETVPIELNSAIESVQLIRDSWTRYDAIARIAAEAAVFDTERAMAIASTIHDAWSRIEAVIGIAEVVARRDTEEAIRLADNLPFEGARDRVRGYVAEQTASIDITKAMAIAATIADPTIRAEVLAVIAERIAHFDAGNAERLIEEAENGLGEIAEESDRNRVLLAVIRSKALVQPVAALEMASNVIDPAVRIVGLSSVAAVLADGNRHLPTVYERIARAASVLSDSDVDRNALVCVVQQVANRDADRAIILASYIGTGWARRRVLASLAGRLNRPKLASRVLLEDPVRSTEVLSALDGLMSASDAAMVAGVGEIVLKGVLEYMST